VSLTDAVKEGRRKGLEALRDELAEAIEDADPPIKAQLAGHLRNILADLDAMEAPEESATDAYRAKLGKPPANVTPLRRRSG
jgi:hypothetical protein